jgi:hypothetical protein
MRHALLLVALAIAPAAQAQGPPSAPVYQRMRMGADQWPTRGGMNGYGRGLGFGSGFGGFFNPYLFAPPIIAGSWYQRPYPYHFDYYRYRWGAPQSGYGGEPGVATPDCPCATPPPVEVVQ